MTGFRRLQHILRELKRRHVTRVAVAYAVVAFGTMQVASTFFPALNLPAWTVTLVAALTIAGLPIVLCLAWAYDITPDGIERTKPLLPGVNASPRSRLVTAVAALTLALGATGAFVVTMDSRPGPDAVAVLPFENFSGDPDNAYFSDGITEDILTQLAQVDDLKVVSRTSVVRYKGTSKPLPEIAKELGVGVVLEGSVRREGNQVRITAQLIDAATDEHLWAKSYDRDITDILAVQSEIAQEIAIALKAKLTPEKKAQFARAAKLRVVPEAYEAYLRGLELARTGRRALSIDQFLKAIEIDPTYAHAHAFLARQYYWQAFLSAKPSRDLYPKVKEYALRALALDDESADAHAALGLYLMHYELDFPAAEREFKRALALAPAKTQIHHDYAHLLLANGRLAESAAESVRAAELDPTNATLQACVGWHRFFDSHYQAAIDGAEKAIANNATAWWPETIRGWGYQHSGNMDLAIQSFRGAVEHSNRRPIALAALAHALATQGQGAEARQLLTEMLNVPPDRYASPYDIAVVYAGLGEANHAITWLKKAHADRATFLVYIGWDPRFKPLHSDPRFQEIMRTIALPSPV